MTKCPVCGVALPEDEHTETTLGGIPVIGCPKYWLPMPAFLGHG